MRFILNRFMLVVIVMSIAAKLSAQTDCGKFFRGTKTLYEPPEIKRNTIPKGYEPVFVNFVGRHGARHPTSLKELQRIQLVLEHADSLGALTAQGKQLQKITRQLLVVEAKYTQGAITETGKSELEGIGARLASNYPFIRDSSRMLVRTTKQERTRQSAKGFLSGMGNSFPTGRGLLNDNDSVCLRFYDISPAYLQFEKKGNWKPLAERLARNDKTLRIVSDIANRLFTRSYVDSLFAKNQEEIVSFILAVYSTATIEKAIEGEIKLAGFSYDAIDITKMLNCKELQWLEIVNDAEDFLVKGPGTNKEGIQVRIAMPLLTDFIQTTDSFINSGNYSTVLRFAHAETIAPFAALLEIDGASTSTSDIQRYKNVWTTSKIIPFSANIQWILYRKKGIKNDYMLTMLLNEQPVKIPVPTDVFPYYHWKDVREFYMRKMARMGAGESQDMYKYLLDLR